ncbi:MAG: hypothetical protein H7339_18540 [Arcicella sp.]|nr:hypothetical protein [Arcicella sp.]
MVQQDTATIKFIIEIGTIAMLIFSGIVIGLVYFLHSRLIEQKHGM